MSHGPPEARRRSCNRPNLRGVHVAPYEPPELSVRIPPAVPAVAAMALLPSAVPLATASTAAVFPAAGTATSAVSLLSLKVASHDVRLGNLALVSDTVSGNPVAKVVVTPLNVDGTAYGEQTVTPTSSPASVPALDSAT